MTQPHFDDNAFDATGSGMEGDLQSPPVRTNSPDPSRNVHSIESPELLHDFNTEMRNVQADVPTREERDRDRLRVIGSSTFQKYLDALEHVEGERDEWKAKAEASYKAQLTEATAIKNRINAVEAERDALRAQVGEPPLGSHPDEAKPRADTWHKERLNWTAEVNALRDAASSTAKRLAEAEGLLREWWEYHFNLTIGGWDVEFSEKVRKALGISGIAVAQEFPHSIQPFPSTPAPSPLCDCPICHGEGFVGSDGTTCDCIKFGCRKRHKRDEYLPSAKAH